MCERFPLSTTSWHLGLMVRFSLICTEYLDEKKYIRVCSGYFCSFLLILTCTILLSDNGLEDETPESDAHDLTEAERTIFGAVSSGDGDVDGIIVLFVAVVNEGQDEAVANK